MAKLCTAMGPVAKSLQEKRGWKRIGGLLPAGVLEGGLVSPPEAGTPHGGPRSPR
jgi:hypothetical protein